MRIERRILTSTDSGFLAAGFLSLFFGRFHWSVNSLNVTVRRRVRFGSRLHVSSRGFLMCQESMNNSGGRQKQIAVPSNQSDFLQYNRPMETSTTFDWTTRNSTTPNQVPRKWMPSRMCCHVVALCQFIRIPHAVPTLHRSKPAGDYFEAI